MFSIFKKNLQLKTDLNEFFSVDSSSICNIKLYSIINRLEECSSDDLNYLASELLKISGYDVQIIDGKHDKGVDVVGLKKNTQEVAIQCKAWTPHRSNKRIDVREVKSFKCSVIERDFKFGIFITTHYFSDVALNEQNEKFILLDRRKLFLLLNKIFPKYMAESLYYKNLSKSLMCCSKCKTGKMIKLYSQNKKFYHWCENCGEFDFNLVKI